MPTLSTLVGILLCTYFAAVRTLPRPSPESNKPRSRPKVLSFSPVLSAQPCHLPPYTILRKSCPLGSTPLPSCISSELGLNCTVRATVEPGDETIRTMRGVCGCRVAHLAAVPGRSSARDRTVTGPRSSASHSALPRSEEHTSELQS